MIMYRQLASLALMMILPLAEAQAEYRLTKADMTEAVKQEFVEQGLGDEVEIEIFGGKTDYYFEQANDAKIMLSNLETDEEQGKFNANAEIFADGEKTTETKLAGRYYKMVKVWVPVKDVVKDTIIKEDDLKEITVREGRLKGGAWQNQADIIGKQAAKNLKAGKLIEKGDLQAEIVVKKGQAVTVVYSKKGLQITSKMQALDNAALGQAVKLLNLGSKKEIVGIAKGAGLVEISNE